MTAQLTLPESMSPRERAAEIATLLATAVGASTKNGKSPGSAGGLEEFDISGSPSGNFKP